jgi:hypothetical protein
MDFVLNSFAILFVGTIDDMGEVKVFHLDFDDDYDLIGFGEYALNYVGLHLRAAKGLSGKMSFFCALLDVNCFAPAHDAHKTPAPGPAHDHENMTRVAAQSRPMMPARRPSSALGWGGVGTKVGQGVNAFKGGSNKGGGMGGESFLGQGSNLDRDPESFL